MIEKNQWRAEWITGGMLFRKLFEITKEVEKAVIRYTGLGYCEAYINGEKITSNVLFPSYTIYEKRVEYIEVDVTSNLLNGRNAVGLMLGAHWDIDNNQQAINVYSEAFYRGRCMGICQLDIYYIDGTTQSIITNSQWKCFESPIVKSSVFDGETYDARKDEENWNEVTFSDNHWRNAIICEGCGRELTKSTIEPIQVIKELEPIWIQKKGEKYIVDFGQNIAGWVRLKVFGENGHRIWIRHGELLYEDGSLNCENLRNALAKDCYICNGNERIYSPRFTYHGFRYAEIEGIPQLQKENIRACVVHSNLKITGDFLCSDESINKIYAAMMWTIRDNMHSIPTDCCQRDERQGWLADAGVASEFVMQNFDAKKFYKKWFQDIRDTQEKDGSLPLAGAPGWPRDTFIWKIGYHMTLRNYYRYTGDLETVRENYKSLQNYERYMQSTLVNGLIPYDFYNDWLALEYANNLMISNAFFADFYDAMILFAEVCEDIEGKREYRQRKKLLNERIQETFYGKCLDSEEGTGYYGTCDTMAIAPSAMALHYGITPDNLQEKVLSVMLKRLCYARGGAQFTTGILTSGILMDFLLEEGLDEIAFEMMNRKEYPSFRFMLDHGATTIWEHWQYLTTNEMNSHNHPALCSTGIWFMKSLAGIRSVNRLKDNKLHLIIKPFTKVPLNWMKANRKLETGKIEIEWKKEGGEITYKIELPENTTATFFNHHGVEQNLGKGNNVLKFHI